LTEIRFYPKISLKGSSMRRTCLALGLSIALFSGPALAQKAWTIIVYMNGDNSLWQAAVDDLNELEVTGSTAEVDVVVQIDLLDRTSRAPFNDTRRYHVTQDPSGNSDTIVSTKVWPETGTRELDMGNPTTLSDFAVWAIDAYPAERYMLLIWNHGDGWKAATAPTDAPPLKLISMDDSSGTAMSISGGDLAEAMASITGHLGRKLDLVGLDACLMGMWEVDVVLESHADYIVQSEETESEAGYDYVRLMALLAAAPATTPRELCDGIVGDSVSSVDGTLSCVETAGVGAVSAGIDAVAAQVMAALPASETALVGAADGTIRFSYSGSGAYTTYADLYDFMARLRASSSLPPSLTEAAAMLQASIEGAVVRSEGIGSYTRTGGISIYLPVASDPPGFDEDYTEGPGALWASHQWDEMLCSFSGVICAPDAYEPDNTSEDAKPIGPEDASQSRSLYPLDDTDIAVARVWQGSRYVFQTRGLLDTYMYLVSDDFDLLDENDDDGTDRNARITWTSPYDGDAYVRVVHWGSTPSGYDPQTGAYTLEMTWGECPQEGVPVCLADGVCEGVARVCETGGTWSCPYPETYEPMDATCDGLDNDCDGGVDDDYLPFLCGTGVCTAESTCTDGIEDCTPPDPPASEDTTCNGLDDDCDGSVDEDGDCPACDPADRPACLEEGVCAGTEPACRGSAWVCPYPADYEETDESCDGLDNDCDGDIDEDGDCGEEAVPEEAVPESHPIETMGSGLACSIALAR
jgi:hypothetical protein